MTVAAWVDRKRRIRCGYRDRNGASTCRAVFGRVEQYVDNTTGQTDLVAMMDDGWKEDTARRGWWIPTTVAQKAFDAAAPEDKLEAMTKTRRPRALFDDRLRPFLPVRLTCPRCKISNLLDAHELGVTEWADILMAEDAVMGLVSPELLSRHPDVRERAAAIVKARGWNEDNLA